MASITAVILPAKALKGGKHKIRISVAHNGKTRYIPTNIIIDSKNEFKNGAVVRRPDAAILNTKIRGLLQRYQELCDDIEFSAGLSCPELIYLMTKGQIEKHPTIKIIYDDYMSCSISKPSTICNHHTMWNTITQFLDPNMLIETISRSTILRLEKGLRKRGLKLSSINVYLTFLRSLLNHAKRSGYVQFKVDPFSRYQMPKGSPRDSWLTVEEIKKLRDYNFKSKSMSKTRDIIMLSYYLGGINFVDLSKIDFRMNDKNIKYIRQKTEHSQKINKYVEFEIPQEAKEIFAKYLNNNGIFNISNIHSKSRLKYKISTAVKYMAKKINMPKLIYYSARKSFSQHAFDLGISTSVIDYILGHKLDRGGTSLYSYISVTPEMATNAIRKVLDNLK